MKKLAFISVLFYFSTGLSQSKMAPITVLDAAGGILTFTTLIKNTIIKNAIIDANPFIHVFDTSVHFQNCKTREWSTAWYGADRNNLDNSVYLQASSDVCIANEISNLFIADNYAYSKPWILSSIYKGFYTGFALNVYGQGDMWSPKTILKYTGDQFAFGVQYAKGGSIRKVKITGNYIAPTYVDSSYYITPFPVRAGYNGIVVDYDNSKNTGGTSGFTIEDTWVDGFDVLYAISPNSVTFNADMIRINHIRCGDGRIGVQSNQAQEKGCEINYIASWGNLHTLIQIGKSGKLQAGGYVIRGGNIANRCVQLFDISLAGWNGFYCEGLAVESVGRMGTILAKTSVYCPAVSLSNMIIRFALKGAAGRQVLFNSNSNKVIISNSSLWYYGEPGPMTFTGNFTFENCDFGNCTWANVGTIVR